MSYGSTSNPMGQVQMTSNQNQFSNGGGRKLRINPLSFQPGDVRAWDGIPQDRTNRMADGIRGGGELAQEKPLFPSVRGYTDGFFAFLFLLSCGGLGWCASYATAGLGSEFSPGQRVPGGSTIAIAAAAGGGASLVAAMLCILLMRISPAFIVWTSLVLPGFVFILLGAACVAMGEAILGTILIAIGAMACTCLCFCMRRDIPLMIKLVEVVATVMQSHPSMMLVSVLGAAFGLGWVLLCSAAFLGVNKGLNQQEGSYVAVFFFVWGTMVSYYLTHTTYCGVFGRWYQKPYDPWPVSASLRVACTTSFGSICMGAMIVAALRVVEAIVRNMRREARENRNVVLCCLLGCAECWIMVIGDIMEYLNEWAYVQCAVRGVSFLEAGKITTTMMICANMGYIIQDLLIETVASLGALVCACAGAAGGAFAGYLLEPTSTVIGVGLALGLFAGMGTGGATAGIISSGTKTILVLWAEDPDPLARLRPEIHESLEQKSALAMG